MAKRRSSSSSSSSSAPTLAWVEETFGLFVSAVPDRHVGRFWLMKKPSGSPVRCVGEVGRRKEALGLPVSLQTVETTDAEGKKLPEPKIGSLPKGRGAGRRIFDFDRIEAVPRAELARRNVRVPLERAIAEGSLKKRTAKDFHAQMLKAHEAEKEAAAAAKKAATASKKTTSSPGDAPGDDDK